MPRITDIELIALEHSMPAAKAYGMARGLTAQRQSSVIRVLTDQGVIGLGEAWGPCRVTAAYLEIVKGYYLGRTIYDHAHVWSLILSKHYHFGIQNQMLACLSGIDMALFDAMGKALGVPVYNLIGGKGRDRIPVYASGGYITRDPENQLAAQMERLAGQGYPGVKIKIGLGPRSDAERVRLAREILGDEPLLMVDVNGNYSVDTARESMARIAPHDVHWYEEPLPPHDFEGLTTLHARAPIRIASGEALYTVADFARLIATGGVDVVQPDLTLCGGLGQGRAIASLCQLKNLRLSPHVWGGALGLAAAVHFMAALPDAPHTENVPYPPLIEYDVGENPIRDDLLEEPVALVDGALVVPDRPGLGVALDAAAVKRLRIA